MSNAAELGRPLSSPYSTSDHDSRSNIVSVGGVVLLNPGDHVCAIYASTAELADTAGEFLAEGLRKSERCWYLPAADEAGAVRAALDTRRVDTTRAIGRGALRIH
jgi:hypothetical protein